MKIIKNFLNKVFFNFKKLFLHNYCQYCQIKIIKEDIFCPSCLNSIGIFVPKFHKKTKILVYSLGKYDGILKFIVTQKYRKNKLVYYALEEKIKIIFDLYKIIDNIDVIIPIPKFSLSRITHSFNPNDIIIEMINKNYSIKDNIKIFSEVYTKKFKAQQVKLKIIEREKNNKNVFTVPNLEKKKLIDQRILFIDDVYTTGATLDALLDELKNISYKSITVFVIASS